MYLYEALYQKLGGWNTPHPETGEPVERGDIDWDDVEEFMGEAEEYFTEEEWKDLKDQ